MRGNVVDLAVAVIIGGAFGQVVNSLVTDVLTPLIGAVGGRPDFSAITLGPILIGKFINSVINFLFVAGAIYFAIVVPMQKLQQIAKKKEQTAPPPPPPEPSEEAKILKEILKTLKKRTPE